MTAAVGDIDGDAPEKGRRWGLIALALVLLGAIGLGVAYLILRPREFPDPPAPTPPPETVEEIPEFDVSVTALGSTGTEEVELWLGTELLDRQTLPQQLQTLSATTTTADGVVELRFVNAGETDDGPRAVIVDHAEVVGQRFEATAPTTVVAGFFDTDAGVCRSEPSLAEVDTLRCNGFVRFAQLVDGVAQPPAAPSETPPEAIDELPDDAKYVAVGGDDAGPGTADEPWGTIQHAVNEAEPGDTIVVRAGVYPESVVVESPGTAEAPIEIRGFPGERPVIRATDGPGMHLEPPGDSIIDLTLEERLDVEPLGYVTIRGFELAGEGNTTEGGWASGFSVDYSRDIRIIDNVIHGFPGGGVSLHTSDNILVTGNQISSVASNGLTQYSGISALQSVNRGGPDIEPGFRMVFRDNTITDVASRLTTTGKEFDATYVSVDDPDDQADNEGEDGLYTDANCIVIDDSLHTQLGSLFPAYDAWSLIENNYCEDNMGRGVQVYLSERVIARGNTLVGNLGANRWYPKPAPFGHDPWREFRWSGELNATRSSQVRFENNTVDNNGGFDRNSFESDDIVFVGNTYLGGPIETAFSDGATYEDEREEPRPG